MVITTLPNHPAPLYVSSPVYALPVKLVKDTVYMPSSVAARVLGPIMRVEQGAPRPAPAEKR